MSWAPATGWLSSMWRTNSSTGGQLEQPSEVKSSRRMGTGGWSGGAGWLAARDGERDAGTTDMVAAKRITRKRAVGKVVKRSNCFDFISDPPGEFILSLFG